MPREPEENTNNQGEPDLVEGEDSRTPEQALTEEKTRAEDYLVNWQRTQADFINYKRRSEQEREELGKYANASLILSLLPVLDDLERAFTSHPSKKPARSGWLDGFKLIESKFRASLEAQGLTALKALGEPFNPNFHEAVREDAGKEGVVIKELQKGYMLHDKLLRPAQVVVGNGAEETKEDN